MRHGYRVEGGDNVVETTGLANAKSAFADMVMDGAKSVTLYELFDGKRFVIGHFGSERPLPM